MELELRHLRAVRAIADTGSLTKAAATLGLAQPALSAQLRRIEKALGGPLFDRDHTGARPTLLGELVLERARVVLPAVSELQEEAVRFANAWGTMERFRLGGTHGPLLGGLVDRLVTAHPAAPVSTYTSWSVAEIASQLVDGRLDFALIGTCGESPPTPGLVTRPITGSPLSWRHLLGWHPRSTAAGAAAGAVSGYTRRRTRRRCSAAQRSAAQRELYALARRASTVRRGDVTCRARRRGYRTPCPSAIATTRAARFRSFSVTTPPASCVFTERETVL